MHEDFLSSTLVPAVRLTIKHTACLTTSSPTVKQVLNRIFRDAQSATGLVQIGRHYFNHEEPTEINKYNINIWPGFSTRIDQYDCGIMATIDTISKVMKSRTVLELMTEWALVRMDDFRSLCFNQCPPLTSNDCRSLSLNRCPQLTSNYCRSLFLSIDVLC